MLGNPHASSTLTFIFRDPTAARIVVGTAGDVGWGSLRCAKLDLRRIFHFLSIRLLSISSRTALEMTLVVVSPTNGRPFLCLGRLACGWSLAFSDVCGQIDERASESERRGHGTCNQRGS